MVTVLGQGRMNDWLAGVGLLVRSTWYVYWY